MAYDLTLTERVRAQLQGIPFVEKKMFGGVGFLIGGNSPALPSTRGRGKCAPGASVSCGVYKDDLVVRVEPEKHTALLKKPHARPFDITGRPMKGWLLVEPDGLRTATQLIAWVRESIEFASSLPRK